MVDVRRCEAETVGCFAIAACFAVLAGWIGWGIFGLAHDKELNVVLQAFHTDSLGAPIGVVIPANNRWIQNAFIADYSLDGSKGVRLIILDDHYRSSDPLYVSKSGVIGDEIDHRVLCSVPAQSEQRNIRIDPVVSKLIASRCGNAG